MSSQIIFFEKNKLDQTFSNVTVTASQGDDFTTFMRNRNNFTAWVTSGSQDSDNTNIECVFDSDVQLTDIILVKHNFDSYTIQYWNGSSYTDFSTAINVSGNTSETTQHNFTQVTTTQIKLIITGTMTPDDDKFLFQFIATDRIGQLEGWPIINPIDDKNRIVSKMLSGKKRIVENIGGLRCSLTVRNWSSDADLLIVEQLYNSKEGFLVWLGGGQESQFTAIRVGYRLEDIYLMKTSNEYNPAYVSGIYTSGVKMKINLEEIA